MMSINDIEGVVRGSGNEAGGSYEPPVYGEETIKTYCDVCGKKKEPEKLTEYHDAGISIMICDKCKRELDIK
jgi:hypothetical protein